MSKVARKPINIPEKTQLKVDNNHILVEGPLGSLEFVKNEGIKLVQQDNLVSIQTDNQDLIALSGTTRALLFNMVHGVSIGWKKSLKLVELFSFRQIFLRPASKSHNDKLILISKY